MARRILLLNDLIRQRHFRRERIFRDRNNPFDMYNNDEIRDRFRFSRGSVVFIVDLVANDLQHRTARNKSIPPLIQVLVALRYYATGSYLRLIGDMFGMDISTVSRIVTNVTNALLRHLDEFIFMPNEEEIIGVKQKFFEIARFPGVVGAIDGTHIRIQRPAGVPDQPYINRKGYPSINVQAICNADRKFIDLYASWPGSCHDAHILRSSNVFRRFEERHFDGYVLGDSGYPCKSWLMTPYLNPNERSKQRYNHSHSLTRVRIEQAFGILKKRFLCLHLEMRFQPEKVCRIFAACAILHNIAINLRENLTIDPEHYNFNVENNNYDGNMNNGFHIRDYIAQTYFSN